MNHLQEEIRKRLNKLETIISNKRKEIEKAPKGIVNIARSGERLQYYFKNSTSDKKRRYIKQEELPLVKALCQKDYDERVVELAEKEYSRLKMLQSLYQKGDCEKIYEKLNEDRKNLVTPISISEEDFVKAWLEQEYSQKGFAPDAPEYYTENGERVRSKSEILIANMLKKYGIPYRYEAPLYLNGLGTIHPDFTVLNVRKRKEYYFEHLGKMDDPEYVDMALHRIDAYERNNIFLGDKLILSFESMQKPMNIRNIERMLLHYLK